MEWWYLNTHIQAGGRDISVFASFFRMVLTQDARTGENIHAHAVTWALVDVATGRYIADCVLDRKAPEFTRERIKNGEGPKDPRVRRAWDEVLARNTVPRPDRLFEQNPVVNPAEYDLKFGGCRLWKEDGAYRLQLAHEDGKTGVDLTLRPEKPIVLHGDNGQVFGSSAEDMFYYFMPRCAVTGSARVDGESLPVTQGQGWYDHEFGRSRSNAGSAIRRGSVAWNWASIQLDNGYDFSAYDLYDLDQDGKHIGHWLVLVGPDGHSTSIQDFTLTEGRRWTSMRTFNDYPVNFTLEIPAHGVRLALEAVTDAQEFQTLISAPAFWEGPVNITGEMAGRAVGGKGFVERSGFNNVDTQKKFFDAVSRQTLEAVDALLPHDPLDARVGRMVADEGHEHMWDGMDVAHFHARVIAPLREMVARGGKAWRSYGFLAALEAVGGDPQKYAQWLALPELLHTGSLIIDDVQDGSLLRRGGPASHITHGVPLAINAGCSAYFLSQLAFLSTGLPADVQLRVYTNYFESMRAAHAGQAMDIAGYWHMVPHVMATGDSSALERAVRSTHRLKSGVPPGNLARAAAAIARGTPQQTEALGRLFEEFGTAFQIVDDVLNLRGFKGDTKTRGEDIREGKLTTPVCKALGLLPPDRRARLVEILEARPEDMQRTMEAIELVTSCGALDACEQEARDLVETAWQRVEPLLENTSAKVMLRTFGWYLLERHY